MKSLGPGRSLNLGSPVNWADPLNRGLVAWYLALPNYKGLQWRNLTSSGLYHGTLTNGPSWKSPIGRPGGFGCIDFNGTNDYVTCPSPSSTFAAADFTVALWIRPPSTIGTQFFWAKGDGSSAGPSLFTRATNNRVEARVGSTGAGTTADGSITGLVWVHVIFARIGTGTTVYLNGVSAATGSGINGNGSSSTAMTIGTVTPAGAYFNGQADDCRIYERGFSASQAYSLYAASRAGYPTQLNWNRRAYGYVAAVGGTVFNPLTGRGGAAAQPVAA